MARRNKRTKTSPLPPKAVRAIFDPAGDIRVRAVTPRGNTYEIVPRVSFLVATDDVDWFFREWDWEHRQRLCRVEDYQPRRAQFNNGRQVEIRPDRPRFDNGEPDIMSPHVELKPEEIVEPVPAVVVDAGETAEDKELVSWP